MSSLLKKTFPILTLLILSGFTLINAQQPTASAQPEKSPPRMIKLFAWDNAITDLEMMGKDGAEKVLIPNGAPTRAMEHEGPPVVQFGKTMINDEGEKEFQVLHQAELPAGTDPVMLIFFPYQNTYRIVPFAESEANFPPGSFRLVNLSPMRFVARMENQTITLANGKRSIFIPNSPGDKRSITVQIASDKSGTWERVYSARWGLLPEKKVTVFLLHDPKLDKLSLKRITE